MQAIDKLDKPTKQQLAGELEKSIASTPDATPQAAPAATGNAASAPSGTNAAPEPAGTNAPPEAPQYTDVERADHKAAGGKYNMKTGEMIPPPAPETPPAATTPATEPVAAEPAPGAAKPDELDAVKKNAGLPTGTPPAKSAPNFSAGQSQAPAPSKVNYSGIPKPKPLPQATTGQGAYSVKSAYGKAAPAATPAATPAAAPQFKGPKINGLQVRNMGEGKKLKFRSNFLGMDL
jgi:hypothetical protein